MSTRIGLQLSLPHYGLTSYHTPAVGSICASAFGNNAEAVVMRVQRHDGARKLSLAAAPAQAHRLLPPPCVILTCTFSRPVEPAVARLYANRVNRRAATAVAAHCGVVPSALLCRRLPWHVDSTANSTLMQK